MMAMFRSWWQQIKQHRVAIGVAGIILVVAIALVIAGYWFDWTGFNGYYQVTTAHTISGPSAGTVVRTEVYQPGKALWDWLQLLIIPAVLAVGGYLFNYTTSRNEQAIASDNQREAAMKEYFDKMSELMLRENLLKSDSDAEVRKIARVLTLTVLPRLDGRRKRSVLQFLHESGLIDKDRKIIHLDGADLIGADLTFADLRNADLSKAILREASLYSASLRNAELRETGLPKADLSGADLKEANLSWALLTDANLTDANLTRANLLGAVLFKANLTGANVTAEQLDKTPFLKGATMPDGKKYAKNQTDSEQDQTNDDF